MANLLACAIVKDGIRLPKGRLSYASLFEKSNVQGETDPDKARFQTSFICKENVDLKLLHELIAKTAKEQWGPECFQKNRIRIPVLKTAEQPKMAAVFEEGYVHLFRTASKMQPSVVRADGRTLADAEEAYSGRFALITVNAFAYDHKTGGKGVSLGLQNVQLLENGPHLGGLRPNASDQFDDLSGEVETADDIYA